MHWNDKQPIYVQLKEKIMAAVLDGSINEGEAIPSIRYVSTEYKVNPITVSKAYQALAEDEIVEKRRGLGMFVLDGARDRLLSHEKARFLAEDWPRILDKIKSLELELEELVL